MSHLLAPQCSALFRLGFLLFFQSLAFFATDRDGSFTSLMNKGRIALELRHLTPDVVNLSQFLFRNQPHSHHRAIDDLDSRQIGRRNDRTRIKVGRSPVGGARRG